MAKCKFKCRLSKFLSILISFCLVVASAPAELLGRSFLAPPGGRKFLQSVFKLSGADTVDPDLKKKIDFSAYDKKGLHITKQDGIISTQDLYRIEPEEKILELRNKIKKPHIKTATPAHKRAYILDAVRSIAWIGKADIAKLLDDEKLDGDTKKYLKEAADMIEKRKLPAFDFITMEGRKALFIFIVLLHTNRHLSEAVTLLHLTKGNISMWSTEDSVYNLLEKYHQHHIELDDIQKEESSNIKTKEYAYRHARALADGDIDGMAGLLNMRTADLKKDLKRKYAYILKEEIDINLQARLKKEVYILIRSGGKITAFDIAEKLKEDELFQNITLESLQRIVWHDAQGFTEILCHPNFIIAEWKEKPEAAAKKGSTRKRSLTLAQREREAIGKAFLWAHWGTSAWNPEEAARILGLPPKTVNHDEWQEKVGIRQYLSEMKKPPVIDKKEIPELNLEKVEEKAYRESWELFGNVEDVVKILDVPRDEAQEKLRYYGLISYEDFLTIDERRVEALKKVLAYTNGDYEKASEISGRNEVTLYRWRETKLPPSFNPKEIEVEISEEDLKNFNFEVIEKEAYADAWRICGNDPKKIGEIVGEEIETVRKKLKKYGYVADDKRIKELRYKEIKERRDDTLEIIKDLNDNSITIGQLIEKLEIKGHKNIYRSKIEFDFTSDERLKLLRKKLKIQVAEKIPEVSQGRKIKYDISTEMPERKGEEDKISIMLHELELIKDVFLKDIRRDLNELKKFAKKDMGIDIEPLKKLIEDKKDKEKEKPSIVSIIPFQYLQKASALNYVFDPKDNTLSVFSTDNLGKNELAEVRKTTRTLKRLQKVKFEPCFLIECVACWAVGRLLCNVLMKDVNMMEEKVLEISKKLPDIDPIIDDKIKSIRNDILILHMQFEEKAYEIVKCFPQLNIQVLEKLGKRISLDTFYFDIFADLQELKRYIMVLFAKELEERQAGHQSIIVSKINSMIEDFESGVGDSEKIYTAIEGLRRTGEGGLADSLKSKLDLLCGVTEISVDRHAGFYMGTRPKRKRKEEELIELQVVMSLPFLTKKEKGDDEKIRAIILKGCEKIRKKEKGREKFGIDDLLLTAVYSKNWRLVQAFLIKIYKDKSLMQNTTINSAAELSLKKIRKAAKRKSGAKKTKKKKSLSVIYILPYLTIPLLAVCGLIAVKQNPSLIDSLLKLKDYSPAVIALSFVAGLALADILNVAGKVLAMKYIFKLSCEVQSGFWGLSVKRDDGPPIYAVHFGKLIFLPILSVSLNIAAVIAGILLVPLSPIFLNVLFFPNVVTFIKDIVRIRSPHSSGYLLFPIIKHILKGKKNYQEVENQLPELQRKKWLTGKYDMGKPLILKPWTFTGEELIHSTSREDIIDGIVTYAQKYQYEELPLVFHIKFEGYLGAGVTTSAKRYEIKSNKEALRATGEAIFECLKEYPPPDIPQSEHEQILRAKYYSLIDAGVNPVYYPTKMMFFLKSLKYFIIRKLPADFNWKPEDARVLVIKFMYSKEWKSKKVRLNRNTNRDLKTSL